MNLHFSIVSCLLIVLKSSEIYGKKCDFTNRFLCDDEECIHADMRCNGIRDCKDGSDEKNCKGYHCVEPNWFRCTNNQCVFPGFKCNGEYDCVDLSDERNCTNFRPAISCDSNEYKCDEGLCIPTSWLCNGVEECLNGSDEKDCYIKTCDGFRCANGQCISKEWRCDGVSDCRDDSDEEKCGNFTIPQFCTGDKQLVLCGDRKTCIKYSQICDGVNDCLDKSDEKSCSRKKCSQVHCSEICVDTKKGGSWCACPKGFGLSSASNCSDIDECDFYGTCDQICKNKKGSYECSCIPDFLLESDNKTCTADHGSPTVIFTDDETVRAVLVRTEMHFSFASNLKEAEGVSFDGDNVYWTERYLNNYVISNGFDDNSQKRGIIDFGLKKPWELAIDYISKNIYLIDIELYFIAACRNDAVYCKVLVHTEGKPQGIALHSEEGEMFWTESGLHPKICYSFMDGSKIDTFLTENILSPTGIAVDSILKRLYWNDDKLKLIQSIKLDKTDRRIIYKATLDHPFSIDVYENRVYWSDWRSHTIESCDRFNGKNHHILAKLKNHNIYFLEVYHSVIHDPAVNPCENHVCSDLCLLQNATYICACPEHKKLTSDRLCTDDGPRQLLILGTRSSIRILTFVNLGKANFTKKSIDLQSIDAISYHIFNDTLIYSNQKTKSIMEYNYRTYKRRIILRDSNFGNITAIDIDYLGDNIYWCDSQKGIVEAYNPKSNTRKVIYKAAGETPRSIALVPEEGLLFLAIQTNKNKYNIQTLSMYEQNNKGIHIIEKDIGEPLYISYNKKMKRVFYVYSSTGKIESVSFSGELKNTYNDSVGSNIIGLTSLKNNIFWIKQKANKLYWAESSNSKLINQKEYALDKNLIEDNIIHLKSITKEEVMMPHKCIFNNGGCSHMCIPNSKDNVFCACPPGMSLDKDGKQCIAFLKCKSDEFMCENSKMCISLKFLCNGKQDCAFGEDENNCAVNTKCPEEYFKCEDGDCIKKDLVCNYHYDCQDRTDESNCKTYLNDTILCLDNEFMCHDKTCILFNKVCDRKNDCPNGEDELHCKHESCNSNEFRCNSGNCIPSQWRCDGDVDCYDNSDEINCKNNKCLPGKFACDNGVCIDLIYRCNKKRDCIDGSDEKKCSPSFTSSCSMGKFGCLQSNQWVCLPDAVRCNGTAECSHQEDEQNCNLCSLEEFQCFNNESCIPNIRVCNGHVDCPDESDESYELCSHIYEDTSNKNINTCKDKFKCKNGACIEFQLVCNNIDNCGDNSDEHGNCSTSCHINGNHCSQGCINTPEGSQCICQPGYRLLSDGLTCTDVKECKQEPRVCSQICIETNGSYACECYKNFTLREDMASCKSDDERMTVVYSSDNTIYLFPQKTKTIDFFMSENTSISDIDVSAHKGFIYFSTSKLGRIYRRNIHLKTYEYIENLEYPTYISVDWLTENVYYVNKGKSNNSIHLCNFDINHCAMIHSFSDTVDITSLVVDPVNAVLFFSTCDYGDNSTAAIYKTKLDGMLPQQIYIDRNDYITSITYDMYKEVLYFSDTKGGMIHKITYDGTDQRMILHDLKYPSELSIFDDHLYISENNISMKVCPLFVNYYLCIDRHLINSVRHQHFQFSIFHPSRQPILDNLCENQCDSLCISSKTLPTCICDITHVNCIRQRKITFNSKKDISPLNEHTSAVKVAVITVVCGIVIVICITLFYYWKKGTNGAFMTVAWSAVKGSDENIEFENPEENT